VNMGMRKLKQKVKEQQGQVGQKLGTVARQVKFQHEEWVENTDRWVTGFLKWFEETCESVENAIKVQLRKGLVRAQHNSSPHFNS